MSADKKPTGGPAFPVVIQPTEQGRAFGDKPQACTGLTIRDSFASAALQGLLSDLPKSLYGMDWQKNVARTAYEIADAMIAERSK